MTANFPNTDRNPVVVLAADENFAMPLAATVRSALDNLAADRKLHIFVLDGGLSDATKQRLEKSWPKGRFEVTWVAVDSSTVSDLPISGGTHYNLTVYYRILMPWLLPKSITRIIHLDADMIICTDLGRLWDEGFDGHLCLAVQDAAMPFMDASAALPNYDRCCRYMGSAQPVPNFRELGLDPRAPYFNAGLLVIDFSGWRAADMPNQLFNCLRENRPHVRWNDQYALNVVLSGRWKQLDWRWNQAWHVFNYPSWSLSPFDRETFEQLREDPYIVHFTTHHKPWRASCRHPLRHMFWDYLKRTDWAGWQPPRLEVFMAALKDQERRFREGRRKLLERGRRLILPRRDRSAA